MEPEDFQVLAKKLVSGTNPAEVRTAISRAYYAAYNCALRTIQQLGFRVAKGPNGHKDVQYRLGNCGDKDVERVGSQLADLHSKRIEADYRLNRSNIENPKNASLAIKIVDRMIETLKTCQTEPRRQKIIRSIRDWESKTSGKSS